MPSRIKVAEELAEIFKIIAHPDRIRLIEALRFGEKDVTSLANELDLRGARVSQHLGLMRAHRIVEERREGRHHFYHLSQPNLAAWIIEALAFIEGRLTLITPHNIADARALWSNPTTDTEEAASESVTAIKTTVSKG